MASKTITIIGSLNTDLVTLTPRVPMGGETLTASSFSTGPGGKGANQAVACARLSRPKPSSVSTSKVTDQPSILVKMMGAVGSDEFGPSLISSLQSSLIDTSSITTIPNTSTGVAVILVESNSGENRILLSPGANHSLQPSSFQTPKSLGYPLPDLVVLQLEIPLETVLQILQTAKAASVPVLLNPAPAVPLPEDAYAGITHLILNESEAAILKGVDLNAVLEGGFEWKSVTDWFLAKGVESVIVTLGSKGAIFATNNVFEHVPAEKEVKVVDTTAAGDTFVGAYAVELVRNEVADAGAMLAAVSKACKAAARTVERKGAQDAIPWADELDR